MELFKPSSLDDLLRLLEERAEKCLFRGQSPENRKLNATLARELLGQSFHLPRNYIPIERLSTWGVRDLYVYIRKILNTFIPGEDVLRPLNGKGDPIFEIIRYIQQNPNQEKIINAIPRHPTPAIEFSESYNIALFFSLDKPNEDGAIFCIKKSSIPVCLSFEEALRAMAQNDDVIPCIIDPLEKLNDLDDQKAKRQEAVYIFQRDLRQPIDFHLQIEKIIIQKALHPVIKEYLAEQNVSDEFVYSRTGVQIGGISS